MGGRAGRELVALPGPPESQIMKGSVEGLERDSKNQ